MSNKLLETWNKLANLGPLNEENAISNSELTNSLKNNAKDIADEVPTMMNDEFAQILKDVKELTKDKVKLNKLMVFIEKLKESS